MAEEQQERRVINTSHRKQRVALGGASAPVAILVAFVIHDLFEKEMSHEVIIALSTAIGSLVTTAGICFWDLRGLVLAWLFRRREGDSQPNRRRSRGRRDD